MTTIANRYDKAMASFRRIHPVQLVVNSGTGQPCGESHIASGLTCHVGETSSEPSKETHHPISLTLTRINPKTMSEDVRMMHPNDSFEIGTMKESGKNGLRVIVKIGNEVWSVKRGNNTDFFKNYDRAKQDAGVWWTHKEGEKWADEASKVKLWRAMWKPKPINNSGQPCGDSFISGEKTCKIGTDDDHDYIQLFERESTPSPNPKFVRQFKSRDEVAAEFGVHEKRLAGRMNDAEKKAVYDYVADDSVNGALRESAVKPLSHSLQEDVVNLDSVIEKSSFPKDAVSTRYIVAPSSHDFKKLIGKAVSQKSYTSTSLESDSYRTQTIDYAEGVDEIMGGAQVVIMRIKLKKDSKAALLSGVEKAATLSPSEVLLPRNAVIQIRSVYDVKNPHMRVGKFKTTIVEADYES